MHLDKWMKKGKSLVRKLYEKHGDLAFEGEDVPVGSFGEFPERNAKAMQSAAEPCVTASRATRKQPRRYQDRSRYLGPQWKCIMCNHMNESGICIYCAYVPELKTPLVAGPGFSRSLMEKIRDRFGTETEDPMETVGRKHG